MQDLNNINKLGIIIVTYNPDIKDFGRNLDYIAKSSFEIIIVDNASNASIQKHIESYINKFKNVHFFALDSNYGIGYAQNVGMELLGTVTHYAFFDQDSYMSSENLKGLFSLFLNIEKADPKAAAIGPSQDYEKLENRSIIKVSKIISSGSIISKQAIKEIGNFRSDFFIDFIDYEWCWRACSKNKTIYKTSVFDIVHESKGVPRKHSHTIDPIFRLYYIYRNATYIIIHEKISIKIKLKLGIRLIGKLIFQLELEKPVSRLSICFSGINDGITGSLSK